MTPVRSLGMRLRPTIEMLPCRTGLAGSTTYRPFVIVGSNRTGTNYLLHLLKNTGQVAGFAEIFSGHGPFWTGRAHSPLSPARARRLRDREPVEFLERAVFRRYPSKIKAVGFKAHYGQLETYPQALSWLSARDDLVVLHLRRRNLIAMATSRQRAFKTGQYLQAPNDPAIDRVRVTLHPGELLHYFGAYDLNIDWPARHLPSAMVVDLWYEDLAADSAAALTDASKSLGVDAAKAVAGTAKQNPLGWRAVVENVDEVEGAVRDTQWGHLLDLPE